MTRQPVLIAHPQTPEQVKAMKAFMKALHIAYEVSDEDDYNPAFVEKLLESREQVKRGEVVYVDPKDLESLLGV